MTIGISLLRYEPDADGLRDAFIADCDTGYACPICCGERTVPIMAELASSPLYGCKDCGARWHGAFEIVSRGRG